MPIAGSPAVGYEIKDGRAFVPLHLESWDAIFLVFEENTAANSLTFSKPEKKLKLVISGNWQVNFNGKTKEVSELKSWTESEDTKYFSGTAAYTKDFELKKLDKKVSYFLELSDVKNVAEVYLNGQEIGTIWKKPYSIDLTKAIKKGKNRIEIKVTNLWVNRLVGDAQPDVQENQLLRRCPFTGPMPHYCLRAYWVP